MKEETMGRLDPVLEDMLFIVPSRNRPENVAQLIHEWDETSEVADLLVAVDNDDPMLEDYRSLDRRTSSVIGVRPFYYGPRLRMGPTLNKLAIANAKSYWAIGFMGDDHRPRTVGWDSRYMAELASLGTGMVYGNDLLQGEKIPTQIVMTSDIIEAIGYMVPPDAIHMYLDNMWKVLGHELNMITYLPDVIVEHMHPLAGKSAVDSGYEEVNAREVYQHDESVFREWLREGLPVAVEQINRIRIGVKNA